MRFNFNKGFGIKEPLTVVTIMLVILYLSVVFICIVQLCNISKQPDTEISYPANSQDISDVSVSQNIQYISKEYDEIYNGELILVNKNYKCHHNGEETVSLYETRSSYGITDNTVCVNADIVDNMNDMFDDFADIYGSTDIMVACAYRSYTTQSELFNNEVQNNGYSYAEKWVAQPGFSEHQTGYVFDLNLNTDDGTGGLKYDGTGIYSRINENCYKYGFILRYPEGKEDITGYEYEPWHFRYVGTAHAIYITKENITLEEYTDTVHAHSVDNPLVINGDNGEQWIVYYVEASGDTVQIPVSADYPYDISGDNYSGFIVTQQVK